MDTEWMMSGRQSPKQKAAIPSRALLLLCRYQDKEWKMTLSRIRFLQLLTTPLRHEDEDSDSASSSSAASVSSDDNEIPVESSPNLPRVFFGVPVLREERDPPRRKSQTGNAVPGAPDDDNTGADRTNDDAAPRAPDDKRLSNRSLSPYVEVQYVIPVEKKAETSTEAPFPPQFK